MKDNLDTLLRKPTPQDVIAAIFSFSYLKKFTNDHSKIQEFILGVKENEDLSSLKPFIFSDKNSSYPLFSETLYNAVRQLTLGKVIYTLAPEYEGFYMNRQMRIEMIKKIGERFSPDQITTLKELGRQWRKFNEDLEESKRFLPAVL